MENDGPGGAIVYRAYHSVKAKLAVRGKPCLAKALRRQTGRRMVAAEIHG
ncbi:hypothetical protein [Thermoactinomyces sp. CICC 10523]|nr:hypothetical protein [Thermoactinomyces sp. CICC 10523]MBH8596709.1 hypothetical protein [Thermoactinomyces sp. CICC 10523]